ncbi:hypothetical protein [Spongiactinospora rosea]|nr:hypothetical protein [Spongiactinospora rosea]
MEFFCHHRDRPGSAALLRAPGPDAARDVLTAGRYTGVEVHDWAFGGRR